MRQTVESFSFLDVFGSTVLIAWLFETSMDDNYFLFWKREKLFLIGSASLFFLFANANLIGFVERYLKLLPLACEGNRQFIEWFDGKYEKYTWRLHARP